jgi:hypothetical protein
VSRGAVLAIEDDGIFADTREKSTWALNEVREDFAKLCTRFSIKVLELP